MEDRPVLEPNAAGIDVGARELSVLRPVDVEFARLIWPTSLI
jgi:hypothetical protein